MPMKKSNFYVFKKNTTRKCVLQTENSDNASISLLDVMNKRRKKKKKQVKAKVFRKENSVPKQSLGFSIGKIQQEKFFLEKQLQDKESELNKANAQIELKEKLLSQLKRDSLKIYIELGEKELEIARLNEQLILQKQNILRVKNHISYLLGNALIRSVKSWQNMIDLPSKLIEIRELARSRRVHGKEKTARSEQYLLSQEGVFTSVKRELQVLPAISAVAKLKQLKIACIMDTFTFNSFMPEAIFQQLTPDGWQKELELFQPEILFVESAWRGEKDLWGNKVGHTSQELINIVQWCKQHHASTLFWNKEDPIHFETFLNTAKLFGHVFTTDIDCISRYKKALGHNQVYFLPFAAQPVVNNPVEKYQRQDKFCFAGAYYVKYPERTKDLNNFVHALPEYRDIDIYDRNFGKHDPDYQFPEPFQPYIVGTLPYEQIDKAYKGYNYAINLNSIKQSQSMFARRVFELLASNTVTVSNFSRGLRLLFGDLVFCSDSGAEIVRRLRLLADDELKLKKFRLAALRKVLTEHTYQDRLNYIYSKLANAEPLKLLPDIVVLSYVKTNAALESVLASFQRQHYAHKLLTVVYTGFEPATAADEKVTYVTTRQAESVMLDQWMKHQWLAVMVPEDFYGVDYLTDLALATRYCQHKVIGKKACYRWQDGLVQTYPKAEYQEVTGLAIRHSMVAGELLPAVNLRSWLATLYTWQSDESGFSVDGLNYCRDGAGYCESLTVFEPLKGINTGLNLGQMQAKAETMEPVARDVSHLKRMDVQELAKRFKPGKDSLCVTALENDKLHIVSQLSDGKHEYWYSDKDYTLAELNASLGSVTLYLEATLGLNLQMVVLFLDAQKHRINHTIFAANKNAEIALPEGTVYLRPGLRVYASGSAEVSNFYLEAKPNMLTELLGACENLILTNHYPSYENLYRNAFVHSRVRAYGEKNITCDVYKLNNDAATSYDEFEGVSVTEGGQEQLKQLLLSGRYKKILVHFLDEKMWRVLKDFSDVEILVWVHGAEVQPFHRREYNYINASLSEIEKAKQISESRINFWRILLRNMPVNFHLIFVSKFFADEVMEDLGYRISEDKYSIIHNPIDTDIFDYVEKPVEQRLKILSIRPFASAKYANDLSVKAILELSKEPFFKDLEFRVIGDGLLFDEILKPLRHFKNVIVEKKFLSQNEIAELYKQYGVFLTPTRWDSQGVSRDEAMSSGLVPVTNAVAAVPEFVDSTCGILAGDNDYVLMAKGISELVYDPKKFVLLSKKASQRVLCQSGKEVIVSKEIDLF